MSVYGYVRVSSQDQNEERQLIAMKKAGVKKSNDPQLCQPDGTGRHQTAAGWRYRSGQGKRRSYGQTEGKTAGKLRGYRPLLGNGKDQTPGRCRKSRRMQEYVLQTSPGTKKERRKSAASQIGLPLWKPKERGKVRYFIMNPSPKGLNMWSSESSESSWIICIYYGILSTLARELPLFDVPSP